MKRAAAARQEEAGLRVGEEEPEGDDIADDADDVTSWVGGNHFALHEGDR